jgi:hypothetical protein
LVKNMSASSRVGSKSTTSCPCELEPVAIHAGAHSRVDDGAKSLCQDDRQAALDQMLWAPASERSRAPALGRQPRIKGHQRVDADHQVGAFVQRHRSVQGLDQGAIDEIALADPDRWKQTRQSGTRLHGDRNRHVIVPLGAEGDRLTGIEIGRDDEQPVLELTKIVAPPAARKQPAQSSWSIPRTVENAGREWHG